MSRRPSRRTAQVLGAMLASEDRWVHGYELVKTLDIASGSLYPILMRLHDRGVLETRWVESPVPNRPRRHLYRLTDEGRSWASAVTAAPKRHRLAGAATELA